MSDMQPVDNMINAIAFGNDVSAGATIEGDKLVIKNFNLESMFDESKPKEVSVPIVNGMVSQKLVEQALKNMGSHLTFPN